jgi:3-deoxy-D-manno-octulosonate 8-phosphate phosphatase (KDO 8-P phosphatase)
LDNHQTKEAGEHIESIARHFINLGGEFVGPADRLASKLVDIGALVFDWDGVFNDGTKGAGNASTFSEADSMGTNLLRYGLLLHNQRMPVTAVISGEKDLSAQGFVLREHFDCLYAGVKNKRVAVDHLRKLFGLEPGAVACVYDDVNDLAMADTCSVRFMIRRPASPLFAAYARTQRLCDYISGCSSDHHAVREISELFLGLLGQYAEVVSSRTAFDSPYRDFFARRQAITPRIYRQADDEIVESFRMDDRRRT